MKVDDTRKYTTYQLINSTQERKVSYSKEDVQKLWEDQKEIKDKGQAKEIEILIEDWQVQKETENYLYVTVDFGLERESAIKIPARCVDKLDNGDYQLFIKKQDRFYFVDKNKLMLGFTVAKNLQNQSGSVPLYSNNATIKLRQIFNEFDFLISKGHDFDTSFEAIGTDLEKTYNKTEAILDKLNKRILEYVEENKAYVRPNTRILKTIENLQQERSDLRKSLNKIEKDIMFYDKSVERFEEYELEQAKNKSQNRPRL